jgi:hypothetical protein
MQTRGKAVIVVPNRRYLDTPEKEPAMPVSPQSPEPDDVDEDPDYELHLTLGEEPGSFAEAEQHECWRQAMAEELASIEANHTWRLIELPPGHRPIGLKWLYKVKKDVSGAVIKHKARLVAKGYV